MKFSVFSNLEYEVYDSATIILNIQAYHSLVQTVIEESLTTTPTIDLEEYTSDITGARYVRVFIPKQGKIKISYKATVDIQPRIIEAKELNRFEGLNHIDDEIIPYLFPSRYCQSDKLNRFANIEFGNIENTYEQVLAIVDWIHEKILYLSGSTNGSTSAADTIIERTGVCRDFAHLGIALCRALSIPARYFAGYAYKLNPPDFHACFEAYIGNEWIFFDATKMVPVNSVVKIAHGHDAADTAVASIFGNANNTASVVGCDSLEAPFDELLQADINRGISYN